MPRSAYSTGVHDSYDPVAFAADAAAAIAERTRVSSIDFALVLGSGWNAAADSLGETLAVLPLGEIPGFAMPVVAGHGGELRLVEVASGRTAAVLTGRTHYYEGKGVAQVVHGVRTVAALGASTLVLTNGCGGLRSEWEPGTPVLISDHINLTAATPLLGATFVDMTNAYSPELRALARIVDPTLPEGVYAQFPGPQYETPAEVRMARTIGADLVGMSTALECIAARAAGLNVLGISLVTNAAAGILGTPLDHAEVIAAGQAARPRLAALLQSLVNVL
jgi:purine-nucleoside phosphorylase